MSFKKLVRDKIPEVIASKGQTPVSRVMNDEEYKTELLKKLVEEAKELQESPGDIGERADIAEVLLAIDRAFAFDLEEIEIARQKKVQERGGFRDKIYLEGVEA